MVLQYQKRSSNIYISNQTLLLFFSFEVVDHTLNKELEMKHEAFIFERENSKVKKHLEYHKNQSK